MNVPTLLGAASSTVWVVLPIGFAIMTYRHTLHAINALRGKGAVTERLPDGP